MHEKVGKQRETEKPHKRAIMQQLAPIAARRAQTDRAFLGQRKGDQRREQNQRRRQRKHQAQRRLGNIGANGSSICVRQRSQRPGQHKHKDKITARAPSSHPAERVAPGVAQNRQTHRHHQWKHRRADDRERGCRDHDRPETVRVTKPEVAQRRAQSEKRQHARARAGAVRDLPPERLRDHADQRRDRQDKSDLGPRQPGVLTQIECKVGIKDPERAKIGEPKQRQRDRMPHRPMIAFIVAVYDGVPSVPDVPIVGFRITLGTFGTHGTIGTRGKLAHMTGTAGQSRAALLISTASFFLWKHSITCNGN